MRILVTGGSGVVGTSTITQLIGRGHEVRLLARHAKHDAAGWPRGVEPWPGDVTRPETLRGAAEGCDVVLHMVAVVGEHPPELTFERVNVQGTRNVIAEAERAGVKRFVYVSSLGAERGESGYHRSKHAGEVSTRGYAGDWVIVRPGNVYGPGDGQISYLLKMMRTLPVVPQIGGGEQEFQPIWHEDAAQAIALACERTDVVRRALDLAGLERTSQRDLVDRLARIIDRHPPRIPLPEFLASLGTRAAAAVGVQLPFNESQLTMLHEGNVVPPDSVNALSDVFGVTPIPLDEGLKRLADVQPEQLPDEGIGALKRKRFWADIQGAAVTPEELFSRFRERFDDVTPVFLGVGVEPGTPRTLDEGATLTLNLPMRGHIQVRVAELAPRQLTLLTLEGHPLAGAVRFLVEDREGRLRFEVQVYDRAATLVDLVMMRALGDLLQNATWARTVERVVELSGGTAPDGDDYEVEELDADQAAEVNAWLEELVMRRKRQEAAESVARA